MTTFPIVGIGSGSYFSAWQACGLTSFPAIDLSGGTNFAYAWKSCGSMTTFPIVGIGSGSFQEAWNGCSSLAELAAIDMSGATSLATALNNCSALASILATGWDLDFSVANCALQAAALDTLYGNLASVAKTITVTGNPGVGADDPSIATAKGWTVTGS